MSRRSQSLTWLLRSCFLHLPPWRDDTSLGGFQRQLEPFLPWIQCRWMQTCGHSLPYSCVLLRLRENKKELWSSKNEDSSFIGETPWISVPALLCSWENFWHSSPLENDNVDLDSVLCKLCCSPLVGHEMKWITTSIKKNEIEENRKYQIISYLLYCFVKSCVCVCALWVCVQRLQCKMLFLLEL